MKIIIKLATTSLIIFALACSGATSSSATKSEDFESSGTGDPGIHAEDIVSPGLSKLDPSSLYEPSTEITTITLPRETHIRFSKGSEINKDKSDFRVSTTTAGWFFLSFAELLQGGSQDLGMLDEAIDQIDPPESGYILADRVMALEGHTYAVKGRDDEAGHFIIVRVTGFGVDSEGTPTITLDYFYR